MIEGESGVNETAAEVSDDNFVVYSEEQADAAEKPADAKPEAKKSELPAEEKPETAQSDEGESSETRKKLGGWQRKLMAKDAEIAELRRQVEGRQNPQQASADVAKLDDGRPDFNDPKYNPDLDKAAPYKFLMDTQAWELEQFKKGMAAEKVATELSQKVGTFNHNLHQTNPEAYEAITELNQAGYINETVRDAILDSPVSVDLAVHLAEYPETLVALQQMTPNQFYKAIGALEAGLVGNKGHKASGQEAAARQTRAAAPISPVTSTTSTGNATSLEDMDFDDFVATRNKQIKARSGY